jgi:hypothetical protein
MSSRQLEFFDVCNAFTGEFPVAFVGTTGSGKTYSINHIMNVNKGQVDMVIGYGGSSGAVQGMHDITLSSLILKEWDDDVLEKIADLNNKAEFPLTLRLACDDFTHESHVHNSPILSRLATAGRHDHFSLILLVHRIHTLQTTVRDSIRRLFVGEIAGSSTFREIREAYGRNVPTKVFSAMLNDTTENHGFLVIDNTGPSNKIRDKFFRYRAHKNPSHGFSGDERVPHLDFAIKLLAEVIREVAHENHPQLQE